MRSRIRENTLRSASTSARDKCSVYSTSARAFFFAFACGIILLHNRYLKFCFSWECWRDYVRSSALTLGFRRKALDRARKAITVPVIQLTLMWMNFTWRYFYVCVSQREFFSFYITF